MSNLNLVHTPAEKPRTGRTAPKSSYGRKAFEMPDVKIINDYHPKRTYQLKINGKIVDNPIKKKKNKSAHVSMREYKDDCRNES